MSDVFNPCFDCDEEGCDKDCGYILPQPDRTLMNLECKCTCKCASC